MDRWTLKVGDMLIVNIGGPPRAGVVTKVRPKSIQYFTCHSGGPGAFFDEKKKTFYDAIDSGKCEHMLIGNTTKWRRKRAPN